ncbi:MAG: flavodoxin domain-containing protein [Thermomicrobiales bacterium]
MKALIVYGSGYGHTAKIARYITQTLRNRAHEVELVDGRAIPPEIDLADYDAVVVGASVNAGGFQRYIIDFVRRNQAQLQQMPSAFFGVSMREAEPDPVHRAKAMRPIDWFLRETGWTPDIVASFAGSIAYLRYRWLMRLIWRRIPLPGDNRSRRPGSSTAPEGYEYTDWDAVSRFTERVEAMVHDVRPASTPA